MRKINIVIADNNNSNAKELKDFLIAKDDIGMVHVINVFDSCDTLCIEKDNNVVDSKDLDLEIKISNTLHKLGIPANIKGYRYLQDAIKLVVDNSSLVYALTKELYPSIATKNNTTVSKVDRAIRHAIKVVSLKGDICAIQDMFNLLIDAEKTRPKNSEFIAKISEKK